MKDMLNMREGAWIELNTAGVVFPRWSHGTRGMLPRLDIRYHGVAQAVYGDRDGARKHNVYRIVP